MAPDPVATEEKAEERHLDAEEKEKAAAGEEARAAKSEGKAMKSLADALKGISARSSRSPKAPKTPSFRSDKDSKSSLLTVFIILAFFLHLIDNFVYGFAPSSARIVVQILMGVFAFFIFTGDKDWAERSKSVLFYALLTGWGILSIAIGNKIAEFTSGLGIEVVTVAAAAVSNSLFTPVWLYYAAFQGRIPPNKLSKFIAHIIIIFWVLVMLITAFANSSLAYGSDMRISQEQKTVAYQIVDSVVTTVTNAGTSTVAGVKSFNWSLANVGELFNRQINYATGQDYYTGQVDSNAQKQLGVYLEEFESSDPELQTDEPVTLYSTLKVQTLDDPVEVSLGCESDGIPPTSLYPTKFVVDEGSNEEDLTCYFERYKFKAGTRSFTMDAQFNFKTLAYLKTYMMDRERIRSFTRQDIDIMDQYKITDKNPVAIYSNGPVMIGMESKEPPVAIDRENDETSLLLGITIDNSWDGEIKDITAVSVIVPKGMVLIEDSVDSGTFCGGYVFKEGSCGSIDVADVERWCDSEKFTVYNIDQTGANSKLGGTKDYKTLKCQLQIPAEAYDEILGKNPYATHYFRVVASYIYQISKSLSVTISEGTPQKNEVKTYECDGVTSFDASAGIPDESLLERYSKYQKVVTDAISADSQNEIKNEQMEALIAAVMTSMTNMGDPIYDSDDAGDAPDYVTGCMYIVPTARNDAKKDIICANSLLQTALESYDGDIKMAISEYKKQVEKYSTDDKKFELDADKLYKEYLMWLNKLCEKSELKTLTKAPLDVSAADTSGDNGGSITVSWKLSEDDGGGSNTVTKYYVYRSEKSGEGFEKVGEVVKGTATYVDTPTDDTKTYYYMVSAVSDDAEVNGTQTNAVQSKPDTGSTDKTVTVSPSEQQTIKDGGEVLFTVTFSDSLKNQVKYLYWAVAGVSKATDTVNSGVGTVTWTFGKNDQGYEGPSTYSIHLTVQDSARSTVSDNDVGSVVVEATS